MTTPTGPADKSTESSRSPAAHTQPLPSSDVDALLSESLHAQSEQDFTWKEPERKPRWFERAEVERTEVAPPHGADSRHIAPGPAARGGGRGVRFGQLVFAAICLLLALWVLLGVVVGVVIEPIVVALGLFALAGISLVVAGLRPARRRRR